MKKVYHIVDEENSLIEKAFKEGCEHGYNKAMKEIEEESIHSSYGEDFEEKIKKLKEKYE
jgi:hypothetical protein